MKKLAITLIVMGGLLSGCIAVEPNSGSYYGDRDRDGVSNRVDRDRDGDGIRNSADRRPDDPRRY
jgi:hypothetical protein